MKQKLLIAAAVLGLAVALWLLFRSPYRNEVNLNAPGEVVAVLGDSVPKGYGCADPNDAWPPRIGRDLGLTVVNASVVGDTTAMGLDRLDADVLSQHPRLVIVELGGNDFLQRLDSNVTRHNLETIFSRIHAAGAMAMFIGVSTPMADDFQDVFQQVTDRNGVYYVPLILRGILAHPDLMSDQIHPNPAGHARIAERLEPLIRGLLRAGDAARR